MSPYSVRYLTTVIPVGDIDSAIKLFVQIILRTHERLFPEQPEIKVECFDNDGAPTVVYLHGRGEAVTLEGVSEQEFAAFGPPAMLLN